VPTERSSAERPAHPGPAASLGILLGLRARGLGTGARIAVVVGVALLVAMTVVSVIFPSQVGLAPELTEAMGRYLPVGYLAFVLTTATAALFGGGGREALPADQVVAFPVGPTTDHLAGLVLAPLNLAWLLQAWTLLASVAVLTHGGHTWAAVVPVVLWLVAATVGVQWLSWVVEYVRRGPRGELFVRTGAVVVGLVIVAVVSTGHLLDVVVLTPAAWASSLPYLGAEGDWLNWLFGCLLLVAAALGAAILGSSTAKLTWTRPATTQARVESRRYAPRPLPRSDLRALVAIDRGSVWRSAPLRRGLVLLSLLPVVVAFAGRLDWLMVPVLPGLVASGGALLFGVNAWALDARGAVWRESLPVAPRTMLVARAWVLVEVLGTASVATLLICGWRAGPPSSTQLSAALCATATIALRTVASALRWSVRRPFSVDLRSVRATPAPPLVMVAYSARLAAAATLTGLAFSVVGRLFTTWWYPVVLAMLLAATSLISLWWTARLWARPAVRSAVVETVASG
jgi:hypothetical protein